MVCRRRAGCERSVQRFLMTMQEKITAAEVKYEAGELLTEEELALLPESLQQTYQEDLADEAEHQQILRECDKTIASVDAFIANLQDGLNAPAARA